MISAFWIAGVHSKLEDHGVPSNNKYVFNGDKLNIASLRTAGVAPCLYRLAKNPRLSCMSNTVSVTGLQRPVTNADVTEGL